MDTPLTPRLLASLYQGAFDAAHWPGALEQLCAAYGARGCSLGNADLVTTAADFGNSSGQLAGTHGYEASAIASYISYYSERDVWRARSTTLQAGEATTAAPCCPTRSWCRRSGTTTGCASRTFSM